MAKQFLTDEIIEHIQDGYYATHEQDLTEEQVHLLTEDQLRYYDKQARAYKAEHKKKMRMFWAIGSVVFVVVVGVCIYGIISVTSGSELYDESNPPDVVDTNAGSQLLGSPPTNSSAGAKDSGAQ